MKIIEKIAAKGQDIQNAKPVTIAFLGDSVTQGCFELDFERTDGGFEPIYDYEAVYHRKVAKLLNMFFPKAPIQIINAGVSGSSAVGALERIENDVVRYMPDLTVVCLGLNDFVKGMSAIAEYGDSLAAIFEILLKNKSEVIFMTPNRCPARVTKKLNPYCGKWIEDIENNVANGTMDRYMEKARTVCREYNIPVCDCYKKWELLEKSGVDITSLLANSLNHPTREMHWLYAVSLVETMMNG